ncbi:MAG: hypothetical protein ACLS9K_05880 [Lachnospira eligens]
MATRNYNYAKEIIDDKYIDEVMKYFKKQIAYDVDGNLKEDDNRTVWIKIHMKYNGNTSKMLICVQVLLLRKMMENYILLECSYCRQRGTFYEQQR